MTHPCPCARCSAPLEPVQQFRFLVETATLDEPAHLARIRRLPAANGRPLPVCKACQAALAAPTRPSRAKPITSVLGVFGALSLGLLFGALFPSRG